MLMMQKKHFFASEKENSSAHSHGLCAHYITLFRIASENSEHLPRFVLRQNSERVLESWGVYGAKFFWKPWTSEVFTTAYNAFPRSPICSDQHCWPDAWVLCIHNSRPFSFYDFSLEAGSGVKLPVGWLACVSLVVDVGVQLPLVDGHVRGLSGLPIDLRSNSFCITFSKASL